jgi:hypothetical protein
MAEMHAAVASLFRATTSRPSVGATFVRLEDAVAAHTEVIARASGKPGRVVVALADDALTCARA